MAEPLTPVSSAMRSLLGLLGETPQQHQQEKQQTKAAGRSHKLPPEAKLTPTEVIAARWASESWRPDARVLFVRLNTCRGCGRDYQAPHWPESFIRERLVADPKTLRYTPSRSRVASSLQLPHFVEVVPVSSFTCHLCPEWAVAQQPQVQSQCLSELLVSHAAGIESSPSQAEATSSTSPEAASSSAAEPTPLQNTEAESLDSSAASTLCSALPAGTKPESMITSVSMGSGSSRGSSDIALFATAAHMLSHITLDKELVSETLQPPVFMTDKEPLDG
jgi:hypothetical protein